MLLSYVVRALRAWRRYRVTLHELSVLSDHELADLGLTRSQIGWVACRWAWRETPATAGTDPRIGRID